MREIYTEIVIDAPPEKVWGVLTDFSAFPQWNPFLKTAEGELCPGKRLQVYIQSLDAVGMTIKPTLLEVEPNRELRWLGHLLIPGLFDWEHYFLIEAQREEQVRFIHGERFTGALVPLMALMGLFGKAVLGFEDMNRALKTRAEGEPIPSE